jgi:hypothetical protein
MESSMSRDFFEYTVVEPTGPGSSWTSRSNAEAYLVEGRVTQAQSLWGDYVFDADGEPVMRQVDPVPPPTSYLARRRVTYGDWERVVDAE